MKFIILGLKEAWITDHTGCRSHQVNGYEGLDVVDHSSSKYRLGELILENDAEVLINL